MIQKHSIEKANNLVGGNLNGSTPSFNHAIANIVKGVPVSHSLFPVHTFHSISNYQQINVYKKYNVYEVSNA